MKKDFRLSAAGRRRKVFDVIHRAGVISAVSATVLGLAGCAVFFYQFNQSKDDILAIRRKQLEEEIAAKQADALKSLNSNPTS